MFRRNSRIVFLLLTVVFGGRSAPAEELSPPPQMDSTRQQSDTLMPPAITDTVDKVIEQISDTVLADTSATRRRLPESTSLRPLMYQPGADSILINAYRTEGVIEPKKSTPTVALFKSVAFPGWGQYSNKKYLKAGLVLVVESYFIYKAVDNGRKASDWREKWKNETGTLKDDYFNTYADYRDERNANLWYTALTVFLSMFDAYVDAHLATFPKQVPKPADLSIGGAPFDGIACNLVFSF